MKEGDKVRLKGGVNVTDEGKRTYFDYPGNVMTVFGVNGSNLEIYEPKEGLPQTVHQLYLEPAND